MHPRSRKSDISGEGNQKQDEWALFLKEPSILLSSAAVTSGQLQNTSRNETAWLCSNKTFLGKISQWESSMLSHDLDMRRQRDTCHHTAICTVWIFAIKRPGIDITSDLFEKNVFLTVCTHVCARICTHVRVLDPLELKLQMAVSHPSLVLGTKWVLHKSRALS